MDLTGKKLVYINRIGFDGENYNYEFYFTDTPNIVWGEKWAEPCACICGDMRPLDTTYTDMVRGKSTYKIFCAQENTCFSMQDIIDGILKLGWCYDDSDLLFSINFAEDYESVFDKINEFVSLIIEEDSEDGE